MEPSMTTITFDTLKFVETLKASGFDESQAKGMTTAIQEVQKSNLDTLATKADLKELELRITGELAILRWGMAVIVGGIIALILKAFFPH